MITHRAKQELPGRLVSILEGKGLYRYFVVDFLFKGANVTMFGCQFLFKAKSGPGESLAEIAFCSGGISNVSLPLSPMASEVLQWGIWVREGLSIQNFPLPSLNRQVFSPMLLLPISLQLTVHV